MKLIQQYNFHRGYFMPNFNTKPRKKATRMKYSVLWSGGKYKYVFKWLVLDTRRQLEYRMICLGYRSD